MYPKSEYLKYPESADKWNKVFFIKNFFLLNCRRFFFVSNVACPTLRNHCTYVAKVWQKNGLTYFSLRNFHNIPKMDDFGYPIRH